MTAFEGADPADDRAERRLRMLEELAEIGMGLARALRRQAEAQADEGSAPTGPNDLGLAFSRVARAVRLTLALEARTSEALTAGRAQAAADREARRLEQAKARALAESQARDRRKNAIHRVVERTIEAEHDSEEAVDRLIGDLYERLDDDEAYGDYLDRPIGETIARICQDLGLTPDWTRWAAEDWAVEEARTGAAGSPYAAVAGEGEGDFTPPPASPQAIGPP